jgi:Fe-S cluster biogenesis protein NfuA
MTQVAEDKEFQSRMGELNGLLEKVQRIADPAARETTGQILQTLMEFHGAGLRKILEHIGDAGELGQSIVRELSQDELVSSLLLLYGLHPMDLESRVKQALEKVRPALASHGGSVELVKVSEEGAVHLRLLGSCHGCGSSTMTLKNTIEQAIYDGAPDVSAIHVEGVEEPASPAASGFVSVEQLIATTTKHSLRGATHVP